MRKTALYLLWLLPFCSFAQQTNLLRDKDADLRHGFELFDKEKYGAAQRYFIKAASIYPDPHTEVRKEAEYYSALCAVELFHRDAEYLLTKFIYEHPESPLVKQAWFQLGKFFFRDKKYKKAVEWFKQVEPDLLTDNEQAEFHFKLGYSYFKTDVYDLALAEFAQVKDTDSDYATTATYYYGHMQYQNGKYEAALEQFQKLSNDDTFGPIVPFYISQIYYMQKRFDSVITYAQPILDSTKSKRGPEIARLIGESYYNTSRYPEAIPYLEQYRDKGKTNRTREDEYQLAFAYFKTNNFKDAITGFEKAVGDQDALGQNAWYHLGWCQLQTGQKKFARNSWGAAAKTDFDTEIKEQALFDYAKLAYELGYDPYDEAVQALQDYMNKYPESGRMDEAYTFLANIYTTTKNYRVALQSLDRIKKKTEPLKAAYQKVAYYRGIELLNDKNYKESIQHFDLSLQYPDHKELAANANYWKAEAQYRAGMYAESVKGYQNFIFGLNSFNQKHYNRANYNLGYAFYKQKDYANALTWFRKYVTSYELAEAKIANDAYNRIADSYFVKSDYSGAIQNYDKAIELKLVDTDYALYQKGNAQRVSGKIEAQLETHKKLLAEYPGSKYVDAAKWETARTYDNLDRFEEAYASYNGILMNHPNSTYAAGAKLNMAQIRYNQNQDSEARILYEEVISKYPGSAQAADAKLGIKRILTESGDVTGIKTMFPEISNIALDSTAWEAAEIQVLKDDNCTRAIGALNNYLKEFPQGLFSLQALGKKADCEMKSKQIDEAAKTYELIIQRPKNEFTAEAYLVLGIYERQKDNLSASIKYFKELEINAQTPDQTLQARSNIMRLSVKTGNMAEATAYAKKVLEGDKVNEELRQEARIIIARDLVSEEKNDEALDELNKLKKVNSEIGAEARYLIALIYHKKGDYKKCEKAVFELVDELPSYDYWLTKAFILLADNYVQLGNVFQAKRTLQSVIDNHEGDELRKLAIRKLESLNAQDEQKKPDEPSEQQNIQFKNNQQNGLFDEPAKPEGEKDE